MSDTEQKHTPLVSSGELRCWRDDGTWFIGDGSCFVAEADNQGNAAYIVEACNAYPDLKSKVEEQIKQIGSYANSNTNLMNDSVSLGMERDRLEAKVEEQATEIKRLNSNLLTVRSERDIYKAEADSARDFLNQMEADNE